MNEPIVKKAGSKVSPVLSEDVYADTDRDLAAKYRRLRVLCGLVFVASVVSLTSFWWFDPSGLATRPDPFDPSPGIIDIAVYPIPHPALAKIPVVPIGARGSLTARPTDTGWINSPAFPVEILNAAPDPGQDKAAHWNLFGTAQAQELSVGEPTPRSNESLNVTQKITDLVLDQPSVTFDRQQMELIIQVTVENAGIEPAGPHLLLIYDVDKLIGIPAIPIEGIPGLSKVSIRQIVAIDEKLQGAVLNIGAVVDTQNQVFEAIEDNNRSALVRIIVPVAGPLESIEPTKGPLPAIDKKLNFEALQSAGRALGDGPPHILDASCLPDGGYCLIGGEKGHLFTWSAPMEASPGGWAPVEVDTNGEDVLQGEVWASSSNGDRTIRGMLADLTLFSNQLVGNELQKRRYRLEQTPNEGFSYNHLNGPAMLPTHPPPHVFESGMVWTVRIDPANRRAVGHQVTIAPQKSATGLSLSIDDTVVVQSIENGELKEFAGRAFPRYVINDSNFTAADPVLLPGATQSVLAISGFLPNLDPPANGENLLSAYGFDDTRPVWFAGEGGFLQAYDPPSATSGGTLRPAARPPTRANLRNVYFQDDTIGWVTSGWFDGNKEGDRPVVLQTTDGGATWTRLSYRHWPAPLSLALVFGLVLLVPATLRARSELLAWTPPARSVADSGTSDAPIGWDDLDVLGLQPIALALSRFMRNVNTAPPVTFAITGPWGTGKSSLMNLVQEDLRQYGARPVWFNAWHHQKEENLVAALLNEVRRAAAPPLWRWSGLVFRARLIWARLPRTLPKFLAFAVPIGLLIFFIGWADSVRYFTSATGGIQGLITNGGPGGLIAGVFAGLGAVGASVVTIWQILAAFRVIPADPSKLLSAVADKGKISDVSDKLSLRHRFATEFGEVCAALRTQRSPGVLIFVDDLDRCQPQNTIEILETVNFLATSGQCFIVMGIDEEKVRHAIAAAFKNQVLNLNQEEVAPNGLLLDKFARSYLEKLINVPIRVPETSPRAVADLLIKAREKNQETEEQAGAKKRPGPVARLCRRYFGSARNMRLKLASTTDGALGIVPMLSVMLVLTYLAAGWSEPLMKAWIDKTSEKTTVAADDLPPNLAVAGATTPEKTDVITPDESEIDVGTDTSPTSIVTPPDQSAKVQLRAVTASDLEGHSLWWAVLFGLAALAAVGLAGVRRLTSLSEPRVEDTNDYHRALEEWSDVIQIATQSPRGAKRFQNRLRFLAMRNRPSAPGTSWVDTLFPPRTAPVAGHRIDERKLVAYGAMERALPEVFDNGDAVDPGMVAKSIVELKKEGELSPAEDAVRKKMDADNADYGSLLSSVEDQRDLQRYLEISGLSPRRAEDMGLPKKD